MLFQIVSFNVESFNTHSAKDLFIFLSVILLLKNLILPVILIY